MQVALERLPNSIAKISVTIEPEIVKQEMDKAFRQVAPRYNIPGFRRGKVPRPIFQRYIGTGPILEEAAQILVNAHYSQALSEAGIDPVAQPNINLVSLVEDQPFQFDIEVESVPEISIEDYSDVLDIPLEKKDLTDELLAEELQRAAKSQAQAIPADEEPVQMGNRVVMSLKGFLVAEGDEDVEPFVEDDSYVVELGSGTAVEGLEEKLVGLTVNAPTIIELTYPEEHPDVSLAGKNVKFEIVVKENKRIEIPELNDELAQTLGYETEQEFRETVSNRLTTRLSDEAKNDRLQQMLGKLKERLIFELPATLVDNAIHRQLRDLEMNLNRMGASVEEYLESRQITGDELHEEMRPRAEVTVREELILSAIAKQEGFTVTDDEVVEAIKPIAQMYQQPVAAIVKLYREQGEFDLVRESMLVSKAGDYLASKVAE